MSLLYETEKVRLALQDFRNATGANIALIQKDFSEIEGVTPIVSTEEEYATEYCKALKTVDRAIEDCIRCDCDLLKRCIQSKK